MSKTLKEEVAEIERVMNQKSPLGFFKRKEEPYYNLLKSDVEHSGRELAIYQYIMATKQAIHQWYTLKLQAFLNGEKFDKSAMESIEEKIAIFEVNLNKGVYHKGEGKI